MNKGGLIIFIIQLVCGLVCLGLGIYYIFYGEPTQIAVFIVVGAVCIATAVRSFIKMRKDKNNEDKDSDNGK